MKEDWKSGYRLRRSLWNLGLVGLVLTLGMIVFAVVAWFNQPTSDLINMPLLIGLMLLFVALYTSFLLIYHRYRLHFNESSIQQIGILGRKQVDVNCVRELKWHCNSKFGRVSLSGKSDQLQIDLGYLEEQARIHVIDFLRFCVAEAKQTGWQEFHKRYFETSQRQQFSNPGRVLIAVIFGIQAIGFAAVWQLDGRIAYLAISFINVVFAVYLLRCYFKEL